MAKLSTARAESYLRTSSNREGNVGRFEASVSARSRNMAQNPMRVAWATNFKVEIEDIIFKTN
jgi:hypothetical protein